MKRFLAVIFACALVGAARNPAPLPSGKKPSAISIVINGMRLPLNPPPRFERGVLFVPVRRTIEAFGLPFNKDGKTIWTQVGARTVSLQIGSRVAHVDASSITLGAAPIEVKYVLYAPLRFFTDAIGAQAIYDRATKTVNIVAQLVGRSGAGIVREANGTERFGTVSAVDVDSDPPTLTLSYNATVKTIPITRNAIVEMRDVNANVVTPGELASIRPGDFARVYLAKNGNVTRVEDAFGSYDGRVAAAAGNEFVLSDGHVIAPTRMTEVSLNGHPAAVGDVHVGDSVTVRYNVETNEVRSILVSRAVKAAAALPGAPAIASVGFGERNALRAGQLLRVTVRGTPGGAATFDIGPYVSDIAMSERAAGTYVGEYRLPHDANFSDAPVIAHLRVQGVDAPAAQAPELLSVSGTAPGIADFAPAQGARVSTRRPAIYATFVTDAVPVDPSSIVLRVNGRDVTSECVRSERYVQYVPSYTYPAGPVRVTIRLADRAGNVTTKSWTFQIAR